eukprot:3260671-Ditylum_brightwellii.AAC.1
MERRKRGHWGSKPAELITMAQDRTSRWGSARRTGLFSFCRRADTFDSTIQREQRLLRKPKDMA